MSGANTTYQSATGLSNGTVSLLNGATQFGGETLGTHLNTNGTPPGVSAGASSGSGASASIDADADDVSGTITLNVGTGPSTGSMVNVTFFLPWNGQHTPTVVITRADANTVGQFYITSVSRTGFTIAASVAPNPSVTYMFNYIVMA